MPFSNMKGLRKLLSFFRKILGDMTHPVGEINQKEEFMGFRKQETQHKRKSKRFPRIIMKVKHKMTAM